MNKKTLKKILALTLCIIMCLGVLTSCGSEPFRKAKKNASVMEDKLEDAGYTAVTYSGSLDHSFGGKLEGVERSIFVSKSDNPDSYGVFMYCDTRWNASTNHNDCMDMVNDDPNNYGDYIVRRNGKMVFMGSEDVWAAATEGRIRDIIVGVIVAIVIISIPIVCIIALIITIAIIRASIKKKKKLERIARRKAMLEQKTEAAIRQTTDYNN